MGSPFDVLRVDPDADDDEIKRAYRRRAKEAHPDQGGSVEEFQRVKAAYEAVLSGRAEPLEDADVEDPAADPGPDEPERTEVEYLNYEVFDDYGWSLDDEDLFERAADAGLDSTDYGRFLVEPAETLLEAAENRGFAWPYACRGGACANCAVVVTEGELSTPVDHILPDEMVERGIRLSCVGKPLTDELSVVYNVKHMPDLEELRLPPRPFERAQDD
ncbi:ferredoxin Fer [Natronomonas marina]|uniref:ferredoxin Fer n=1 Tax=Natronomonas marina TaxID=2961939 RepID=UPI0020C999A3|nr:ferredoxin Fer [Natronomonas marina]